MTWVIFLSNFNLLTVQVWKIYMKKKQTQNYLAGRNDTDLKVATPCLQTLKAEPFRLLLLGRKHFAFFLFSILFHNFKVLNLRSPKIQKFSLKSRPHSNTYPRVRGCPYCYKLLYTAIPDKEITCLCAQCILFISSRTLFKLH